MGVMAEKLQEVAHGIRRLIPRHKMDILDEIFRVWKLEECLERQEVGMYITFN
jgi:hypothetical protein